MTDERRQLRRDFPFRRVAVVLSGGGALGAYEVGVMRVLEHLGLRPKIVAGVSVGATNAVVWLAHDLKTAALERVWKRVGPSSIGMSWATLTLRAGGVFLELFAALGLLLTIGGSPQLNIHSRFRRIDDAYGFEFYSLVLESLAWITVGLAGYAMMVFSRPLEGALAHLMTSSEPAQRQRWLLRTILVGLALYTLVIVLGVPWPWGFHVSLLVVAIALWLANRPGRSRDSIRNIYLRLLPETGGRGLWRGGARRRLVERIIAQGDPGLLVEGDVHLIISACAVDNGRMGYFVNWSDVTPEFRARIHEALGEVVEMRTVNEVVAATVASGAVPVLFQPATVRGREYLDGGLFSNQPLRAVVADEADAILVVLVSPSAGLPAPSRDANLVELGARVQDIANWRDLQQELQHLPPGWSVRGDPARVCVVEPESRLPGTQLGFDPKVAVELIRLGERDAWAALERAQWLAPSLRAAEA